MIGFGSGFGFTAGIVIMIMLLGGGYEEIDRVSSLEGWQSMPVNGGAYIPTLIPAPTLTPLPTQIPAQLELCERGNAALWEGMRVAGMSGMQGREAEEEAYSLSWTALWDYEITTLYDFAQFLKRCESAGFTGKGF